MTTHCVDWTDYAQAAELAAGNHRQWDSFAWHDRPENDGEWAIVYVSNRDSGLLDQSNAAAIEKLLTLHLEAEEPDIFRERHSHWAVGYVDGYAIRVYHGENGRKAVTEAFNAWCDIQARLADYPLLDEEDHSTREYDDTLSNIRDAGRRLIKDDAPENWEHEVFQWFWDNDQRAVAPRDDWGGYPSDEQMRAALEALDLLDTE